MKTEHFILHGADGLSLPGIIWLPDGEPIALLRITHGMTEHMGRYTAFAEALTCRGIAAAGFDLRGHGGSPSPDGCAPDCASFGETGWNAALSDMERFGTEMNRRFPGIPHFHLGFSLGSFLLREYLNRPGHGLSGAVILGTGHQPGAVLSLMAAIVKGEIKKCGFNGTTSLVKQLSFGAYNRLFAPNRTESDWLCADETELDAYISDPLCRKNISAGLFFQLLSAMKRTGASSAYKNWDKNLPVLLISGGSDPVGDGGKGVERVKKAMDRAGIGNVTMKLWPGARHDLLREETSGSAGQAREMITDWILSRVKG